MVHARTRGGARGRAAGMKRIGLRSVRWLAAGSAALAQSRTRSAVPLIMRFCAAVLCVCSGPHEIDVRDEQGSLRYSWSQSPDFISIKLHWPVL